MTLHYQAADMREIVNTFDVLAHFGHAMDGGEEVRSNECPFCGKGREIFGVNARVAHCFRCHKKGDAIDLYRMLSGMGDARLPTVLAAMGETFRIKPSDISPEELAARQVERAKREVEQRERRAEQQRIAVSNVPAGWALASLRDRRGEDYLRHRGVGALVGRHDLIRYDSDGNPCILLHSFDDAMVNIVTRLIDGADRKIVSRKHCPAIGTFGQLGELGSTSGSVFIVEGMFDWLTGEMLFRPDGNLVLGAHGCGNLAKIASALAPLLVARARRVCFVAHEDDAGAAAVEEAIDNITAAGLAFDPSIDLFNLGGSADLNDALVKGTGDVRDYI